MPTIRKVTNFAIGGGGPISPLSGDQYEFLGFPARVAFAIVATGATADTALVTATVYSGSDLLQQNGPVTRKAAGGTVLNPDDFLLDDVAGAGDRLNVILNAGAIAAAVAVETVVLITPIT